MISKKLKGAGNKEGVLMKKTRKFTGNTIKAFFCKRRFTGTGVAQELDEDNQGRNGIEFGWLVEL